MIQLDIDKMKALKARLEYCNIPENIRTDIKNDILSLSELEDIYFYNLTDIKNVWVLSVKEKWQYIANMLPLGFYIRAGKIETDKSRQKYGKYWIFFNDFTGQIIFSNKQDSEGGYIDYTTIKVETILIKELNKIVSIVRNQEKREVLQMNFPNLY